MVTQQKREKFRELELMQCLIFAGGSEREMFLAEKKSSVFN